MTRVTSLRRSCCSGHLTTIFVFTLLVAMSAAPTPAIQQLQGRVVADADGSPLAHVRVLVGMRAVGETNDSGQFDVSVPAGKALVHVEKAGYLLQPVDREGPHEIIRMFRGATLIVRVVDEAGSPVGGRNVGIAGPRGYAIKVTDDHGVVRLTGLAAGRYAADVDRFVVPKADDADERARLRERDANMQEALQRRRPFGSQLKEGGELTLTVTDAFRPFKATRGDSKGATIKGRVADAAGAPVAAARITLVSQRAERAVRADASGTYSFEGITPGKYTVIAQAAGFMAVPFGHAPGVRAEVVTLTAGQRRDAADLRLYHGGAVSGTVRDEHGNAHELFEVQIFAVNPGTHDRVSEAADAQTMTDDQGRYRIAGVQSGSYIVLARPRPGRTEGPIYYPAAMRFEDATPLQIMEETEQTGIDFVSDPERGARISGVVTDSTGTTIRSGSVRMHGTSTATSGMRDREASIDADGRFEFMSVPAGAYTLATGSQRGFDSLEILGIMPSPVTLTLAPRESGGTDIVVTGKQSRVADIQTSLNAMVTGHVVLDDPTAGVAPGSFELSAARDDARTVVRDDWTFALRDISGTSRLTLTAAPPGWWLKSISLKGVNAADVPVEFGHPEHSRHGVTAILSHTAATISGRVEDERGTALPNASVVVFSVDRSRWEDRSLHRQAVRADAGGSYVVNVPPGEYWVVAADAPTLSAKVLDGFTKSATRVTAAASATVTQNLRSTRRP